jgi:hypothetical protein
MNREGYPSPARALLPLLLWRPLLVAIHARTPPPCGGFRRQVAPARVFARAHQAGRMRQVPLPQRLGVAAPIAHAQAAVAPNALPRPAKCVLGGCLRSSRLSPSVGRQGWQSTPLGWAEEFGAGELSVGASGFGACGVEGCGVDELVEVVSGCVLWCSPSGCPIWGCLKCLIVGIGIPDGAFVFQGMWEC